MKVAVLSESPADEAAIRVLVEALLGQPIESPALPSIRSRGWPSVAGILPSIIKHLHYQTDADGLVVVVDSNGSPLHDPAGGSTKNEKSRARLAVMSRIVERTRADLRPVPVRAPLGVAVGVAAPAIEAWYRCGQDQTATEVAWLRDLEAGVQAPARIRSLKRAVYGAEVYALSHETQRAVEHARRLAADLDMLEKHFPIGFGSLAREVRGWRGA